MLTDTNKGITNISYNYLNLPTQVTIAGQNITYLYDATGVKQQKTASGIVTDYAGGFIYEGGQLKFFSQPEGYVAYNSGAFDYIYQYKDHLGNVRLGYDKNLVIQEENNYYPFGLKHKGYNNVSVLTTGNSTAQKFKFSGKELQDELGLGFYDYGARNYDPALGRWMNIDPLAENSRRWTPYNYAYNNPIYFVDPDGMESEGFRYDEKQLAEMREDNKKFVEWVNNGGNNYGSIDPPKKKKLNTIVNIEQREYVQGGYVGQGLDELITAGIQWLGEEISGSDVS